MLKTRWYVCPVCGNVISAAGEGAFHCCGIALPALEAEEPDSCHKAEITLLDGEYHVRMADHPMTKAHYISFFAAVTSDRVTLVKLYPEQESETRLPARGRGWLYYCCNQHGLFRMPLPPYRNSKAR